MVFVNKSNTIYNIINEVVDTMRNEECINKVIEFSEKFYDSLDFAHNMEHGKRVIKNILYKLLIV